MYAASTPIHWAVSVVGDLFFGLFFGIEIWLSTKALWCGTDQLARVANPPSWKWGHNNALIQYRSTYLQRFLQAGPFDTPPPKRHRCWLRGGGTKAQRWRFFLTFFFFFRCVLFWVRHTCLQVLISGSNKTLDVEDLRRHTRQALRSVGRGVRLTLYYCPCLRASLSRRLLRPHLSSTVYMCRRNNLVSR